MADLALGLQILRIYATDEVRLLEGGNYLCVFDQKDKRVVLPASQVSRLQAAGWLLSEKHGWMFHFG